MKISYIVPVYRTELTLHKCLKMLLDQDYKNAEIICVIDGLKVDKEAVKTKRDMMIADFIEKAEDKKTAKRNVKKRITSRDAKAAIIVEDKQKKEGYKRVIARNSKDIKIIELDGNHGAPYARNKGAEAATGDILWFFDSDCYLLPGQARLAIEAFEDHPDCAFVYGNYLILDKPQQRMISGRPWDPYVLRNMNYISTMSPIRKEAFQGWDEAVPHLQDWDMWLRMANKGMKGWYIESENAMFETEPSMMGSITYHTPDKWLPRVDFIQKKNGIERSDTVITSIGAMNHALHVAKTLGVDVHVYPSFRPHTWKKIILLGFYTNGGAEGVRQHLGMLADYQGKQIEGAKPIIYWIGSDILQLYDLVPLNAIKAMARDFKNKGVINLTECQATHDELKFVGLDSKVIPIPPPKIFDVMPLPKEFSVGIYINGTQPQIYYFDYMQEVARSMPDVKFKFFGMGDTKAPKEIKNCEFYPRVDMEEFLKETACVLRVTKHDGLPLNPIEFVLAGRQAVISLGDGKMHAEMKHMICIPTEAEGETWDVLKPKVLAGIREAQTKFEAGEINQVGHDYWADHMSHEKFKAAINAL